MISMNLHQVASLLGATLIGKPTHFKGVTTDSRTNNEGKLFIALKGDNFNGEDFVSQAIENGAVAVLCSSPQDGNVSQLIVDDTLDSLTVLAKNWAQQCSAKKIGITGSNGKTTVKNMLHSILSQSHKCFATPGNFNNEIGVPLSLCQISKRDDFAVIEMGAAQIGDIAQLVSLVSLDSACITSISAAHIGRFGSLKNIVKGKSEIFSNLNENNYAIFNPEIEELADIERGLNCKTLTFGSQEKQNVSISSEKPFVLKVSANQFYELEINLPILGKHNQQNAACAGALAASLGISGDDIKQGLEKFEAEKGRLEVLGDINNCFVINDSYNANPASMKAAIDVLAEFEGTRTLIVGDMAELGSDAKELHKETGKLAATNKIDNLIAIGKYSGQIKFGFGGSALSFKNKDEATKYIKTNWNRFGTVLFKASRSMQLETIIEKINSKGEAA